MKAIKRIDIKETQRLATVNGGDYVVMQLLVDKVNELVAVHNDKVADSRKDKK